MVVDGCAQTDTKYDDKTTQVCKCNDDGGECVGNEDKPHWLMGDSNVNRCLLLGL